jgi:hypothetical protein
MPDLALSGLNQARILLTPQPSLLARLSLPQGNEPADPSAITTIHAPEPATTEPPTDAPRDPAIPA